MSSNQNNEQQRRRSSNLSDASQDFNEMHEQGKMGSQKNKTSTKLSPSRYVIESTPNNSLRKVSTKKEESKDWNGIKKIYNNGDYASNNSVPKNLKIVRWYRPMEKLTPTTKALSLSRTEYFLENNACFHFEFLGFCRYDNCKYDHSYPNGWG